MKRKLARLPNGELITISDLPKQGANRWTPKRKAVVVYAVKLGLLSLEDACARYTLTEDEFLSWSRHLLDHGVPGLRQTKLQVYRQLST